MRFIIIAWIFFTPSAVQGRIDLPNLPRLGKTVSQRFEDTTARSKGLLGRVGVTPLKSGRSHRSAAAKSEIKKQNDENVANMMSVINLLGWKSVVVIDGLHPISVSTRNLPPGTHLANDAANDVAAEKFKCIKATAVIHAPPRVVYRLFLDNSRVNEYNVHCHELEDVEQLTSDTKIAWSATKKLAPMIKARDFVTNVHYRETKDGILMAVNRPAIHKSKPVNSNFQRAEVLLAGNVMEPVPGDPGKTKLTLITHINPGGIVDNAIGAALINKVTSFIKCS